MIFAATLYAQRPIPGSVLISYGARAIRADNKDEATVIAKRDAEENWPHSEGWIHQFAFAEVPEQWMTDEVQCSMPHVANGEYVAKNLETSASENLDEAHRVLLPWLRLKFRARARAFESAAMLVRRELL